MITSVRKAPAGVLLIARLALLGVAAPVLAEGVAPIVGTNGQGDAFFFEFDSPPYRIEREVTASGSQRSRIVTIDGSACEYQHGAGQRSFYCGAATPAPLTSTRYEGERVAGSCKDEDDEFVYRCVEGCDQQTAAPLELAQGYWDCDDVQ